MNEKRHRILVELLSAMSTMQASVRAGGLAHSHTHHQPFSKQQLELMFVVREAGTVSIKGIAEQLNITSGAVSQLVEHLQGRGLLERVPSPDDRRSVLIRLSRAGQHKFKRYYGQRLDKLAGFFAALDDDELAQFVSYLKKIMAHQAEINSK